MRIGTITSGVCAFLLSIVPAATLPASAATTPSWHLISGVSWLKAQVVDGYIPYDAAPDLGSTVQSATALAYAARDGARASNILGQMTSYIDANVDAYVDGTNPASSTNDGAGALARLILLKQATGTADPSDLVSRLEATQQISGLFGASDPSYDGTLRQGLAMVALHRAGVAWNDPSMTAARRWLVAQQCSNGGFSADAAAPALSGCLPEPTSSLGADTNSTAIALWALSATNGAPSLLPRVRSGLSFLKSNERAHSTWGWFPGDPSDCNSTALVDLALLATSQSLTASTGEWAVGGTSPLHGLDRFQVRPLDTPSTAGGFRYQLNATYPTPDVFSSEQALLTLSIAGA